MKEGFEQSDQQRLASKLQDKSSQNQIVNTFFDIPEAKPLLSKNLIDLQKAKVLIKQIDIFHQPPQLLSSNLHKQVFSNDKPHNAKPPNFKNIQSTTIWEKYIISQSYKILYLKYYKESIVQVQKKSFKRYKHELQKLCRNQQYLFSTYIIDFSFLNEAGTYLLRNLKTSQANDVFSTSIDTQIEFNSRFQSGNLFAVFEKNIQATNTPTNTKQYDLILQNDINSKGFSNWFYFSIRIKKKSSIKFNIVNMQKKYSLHPDGMKITVFSFRRYQNQKIEWHRDGYSYSYYRNQLRKNNENQLTFNTLTFSYDVKYDDDLIFFSASIPYSYTKMLRYLDSIEKVAKLNTNIYFKKQSVGVSISNNICPILTLTWKKKKDQKKKKKKIIAVIARQHPSETVSSYVMQGFINSLVYLNSQSSVLLLQNYIFKIIPMVNVDGVIYGNSRCDITGTDINRKWSRNPNKYIYPIISQIKNVLARLLHDSYQIDYFIDLHGHSRKMGAFVYGCKGPDDLESRQTAWIMSMLNSKILFEESQFGLSYFKKETARGCLSDMVQFKRSMTIETSFYGYKTVGSKHWQIKDLQKIGSTLIEAIYAQQVKDPKIFNWQNIKKEIKQAMQNAEAVKRKKVVKEESQSSFGSDSNPSIDQMNQKQKAQYFLDQTTATKIGLHQIKVVKKQNKKVSLDRDRIEKQDSEKNVQKYGMIVDGFKERIEFMKGELSQMLTPFSGEKQTFYGKQSLKYKQGEEKLQMLLPRHSKSTTKIIPFKFSQRLEKVEQQKIHRKSVEIRVRKQQQLLPSDSKRVQVKSNFWSNLKKQYQTLLIERKLKDI